MPQANCCCSADLNSSSYVQFKKYEAPPFGIDDSNTTPPGQPSEYFSFNHRNAANKYGPPMIERRIPIQDGFTKTVPVAINEDFFAAILGSEVCGKMIFFTPDQRFYRFDTDKDWYVLATDEDMKLALSQAIIACCQCVNPSMVDIEALFRFRDDETLEKIIKRARSILAKGVEFFNHESGNKRSAALVPEVAVQRFVDECIEEDDGALLTIGECQEAYLEYSKLNGYPFIARQGFTAVMTAAIRQKFNRSLRMDLLTLGASQSRGYKGLTWKKNV